MCFRLPLLLGLRISVAAFLPNLLILQPSLLARLSVLPGALSFISGRGVWLALLLVRSLLARRGPLLSSFLLTFVALSGFLSVLRPGLLVLLPSLALLPSLLVLLVVLLSGLLRALLAWNAGFLTALLVLLRLRLARLPCGLLLIAPLALLTGLFIPTRGTLATLLALP